MLDDFNFHPFWVSGSIIPFHLAGKAARTLVGKMHQGKLIRKQRAVVLAERRERRPMR